MDDALVRAALDLSGRPFLVWKVAFPTAKIGTFDTELVREFFQALATHGGITLHVDRLHGINSHHIAEAAFKAVARSLARGGRDRPAQGRRHPVDQGHAVTLTALVDYDSGNLHSAQKAFERMAAETGAGAVVVRRPEVVARADRIVLPGDGAFPACRPALMAVPGLAEAIVEAVTCGAAVPGHLRRHADAGTTGHEYEDAGFRLDPGEVRRIAPGRRAEGAAHGLERSGDRPARIRCSTGSPRATTPISCIPMHMQVADPADLLAHVDYGGPVTAIVARGNVIGTQFHPEKSQAPACG
jgi:imidazole glycerol-phosphate synthase subunit HisH